MRLRAARLSQDAIELHLDRRRERAQARVELLTAHDRVSGGFERVCRAGRLDEQLRAIRVAHVVVESAAQPANFSVTINCYCHVTRKFIKKYLGAAVASV